jgi:hypothetical protein
MYQYVEKPGELRLGVEQRVDVVEAPGFLLTVAAMAWGSLDAKYVRIHVEIDGPDRAYPIDFTAKGLHDYGKERPDNFGPYLTVYDDVNKVYAGIMTPSHPIPVARRFELKLIPPSQPVEEASPLPIKYHGVYALAKIIDAEELRRSLQELLWPIRRLEEARRA